MALNNLQSWLKKTCPNFYRHTLLHSGDFELILEFVRTRKFDVLNFCLLMEKVCKGEFEFTIEALDLISKSNLNFSRLLNVNDEIDDLIDEGEAAILLNMKDVVEFRRYITGKGLLTPLDLPDKVSNKYFIKKHVLWLREVRGIEA